MFVFVCWTPYQIFNAINFVMNNVENSKDNADIYIYHEFGGAEKISSRLRETNVFLHVYDVNIYDHGRVWYSKFNKIKRLLCPNMTIRKYLQADIDVRDQGYKTLVVSGNNLFSVNLYNAIDNLEVYFIDDGIGSYFGDLRADYMTSLYKIFNKVFKRGPLSYDIKKFYVNNKSICQSTICKDIRQLPTLQSDNPVFDVLEAVFDYKNNDNYQLNELIYLSQPYCEVEQYIKGTEEQVLCELDHVFTKDNVLLRLHPRQKAEQFPQWKLDLLRNLWELECVKQVNDNSILISGFSTAQFLPKILVDKEPYAIFLYKLYYPESFTAQFNVVIESLKGLYAKPDKIQVPENQEDFKTIITKIKSESERP